MHENRRGRSDRFASTLLPSSLSSSSLVLLERVSMLCSERGPRTPRTCCGLRRDHRPSPRCTATLRSAARTRNVRAPLPREADSHAATSPRCRTLEVEHLELFLFEGTRFCRTHGSFIQTSSTPPRLCSRDRQGLGKEGGVRGSVFPCISRALGCARSTLSSLLLLPGSSICSSRACL